MPTRIEIHRLERAIVNLGYPDIPLSDSPTVPTPLAISIVVSVSNDFTSTAPVVQFPSPCAMGLVDLSKV